LIFPKFIISHLGGPNPGEAFQGSQGHGDKCRFQPQHETTG